MPSSGSRATATPSGSTDAVREQVAGADGRPSASRTTPVRRSTETGSSPTPPGVGATGVVDLADPAVEELVLVHRETVAAPRPEHRDLGARRARRRSIQSRSTPRMPWKSAPAPACRTPYGYGPYQIGLRGDEPVDEHDRAAATSAQPPRHEDEGGRERQRAEEREPLEPARCAQWSWIAHQGSSISVSDTADVVDEAVEGDREHEQRGGERRPRSRSHAAAAPRARPRRAGGSGTAARARTCCAPGSGRRSARRTCRRRRASRREQRRSSRRGAPAAACRATRARAEQHDRRGDRDHAEVQVELGQVVDDEMERARDVVVAPRRRPHRSRGGRSAASRARPAPPRRRARTGAERSRTAQRYGQSVACSAPARNRRAGAGAVTAAAATTIACERVRYASPRAAKKRDVAGRRSAARAPRRERARRGGRSGSRRSRSSRSPCRPSTARATAITAASSADHWPTTRRAMRYAGTAARDITRLLIVFSAAYASGMRSKSAYAGAIRIGYTAPKPRTGTPRTAKPEPEARSSPSPSR